MQGRIYFSPSEFGEFGHPYMTIMETGACEPLQVHLYIPYFTAATATFWSLQIGVRWNDLDYPPALLSSYNYGSPCHEGPFGSMRGISWTQHWSPKVCGLWASCRTNFGGAIWAGVILLVSLSLTEFSSLFLWHQTQQFRQIRGRNASLIFMH